MAFLTKAGRELVALILADHQSPGSRMSDRALADALDVSRTPVREALLRLEREEFLTSDPHRGFFVRELTVGEVRQVYPVIAALEIECLRTTDALLPETEQRLLDLNERLGGSVKDPVARVELDMSWHEALTGSAGNRYASTLLAGAKNLIRRYEYAYMREAGHVPLSIGMHNEILAAAKAGDREHVVLLLEDHWRSGMRAVEDWLSKREAVTAR